MDFINIQFPRILRAAMIPCLCGGAVEKYVGFEVQLERICEMRQREGYSDIWISLEGW